jgi:hypothetical protein
MEARTDSRSTPTGSFSGFLNSYLHEKALHDWTFHIPHDFLVTEEKERFERQMLTDEKRRRLRNEVYGDEEMITETDVMLQNGTRLVR